ncbi:branched-chain amino acid ABC transporter permease [Candidatus Sumerlaeota bacterium]|nr:branched-chain amino acid ABC transporter permease [Candidatus Sumerlaeota bacterium]
MGWHNRIGLVVFAVAIGIVPWLLPSWYYKLIHIGFYALICIGLSLLMGYAGQISLGHAAFYAIGAYTSAVLCTRLGWSPWVAVWAGVALSMLIAWVVGIPSLRLHGHYLAMATLAFGEIVSVVAKAWIRVTGGPSGLGNIPLLSAFGHRLKTYGTDTQTFYVVWAVVLIGLVLAINLIHSRVGRALRSIHDGEIPANVLGVATASYKVKVFVLSAAYASVAGSLYVHVTGYINPSPFGVENSILFVIMVIVGGMRTVWGAVVGACVMGVLSELLADLETWRFLVYGVVLLLIMLFLPQGALLGLRDLCVRIATATGLWRPRTTK